MHQHRGNDGDLLLVQVDSSQLNSSLQVAVIQQIGALNGLSALLGGVTTSTLASNQGHPLLLLSVYTLRWLDTPAQSTVIKNKSTLNRL